MASISTISDDFNDNSTNLTLWTPFAVAGLTSEVNSQLRLVPASNNAGYSGYNSVNGYDLTGSQVTMQCVQSLSSDPSCQMGLSLVVNGDGTSQLYTTIVGSNLTFNYKVSGTDHITTVTWNASTMGWWRIRENSGTVYWDTSPDGTNWTNQLNVATPITITNLLVSIFGGTQANVASPGMGILDNFNVAPQTAVMFWVKA